MWVKAFVLVCILSLKRCYSTNKSKNALIFFLFYFLFLPAHLEVPRGFLEWDTKVIKHQYSLLLII